MPNVAMNGKTSNAKYVTAEEGGTQVIFAGNQCTSQRRRSTFPWIDSCSKLELILALMCFFLTIVVIALIIMLAAGTQQKEDDMAKGDLPKGTAAQTGDPNAVIGPDGERVQVNGGQGGMTTGYTIPEGIGLEDICLTPGCVNAASRVLNSLDKGVKPCDNFFDFACGNWNKKNIIPEDKSHYNTFTKLGDDLQVILKNLLEQPIDNDPEATVKAKNLYLSCLNETQIDREGLEPTKNLLADLGGWPLLGDRNWKQITDKDVLDLLVKLRLYDNKILIEMWVAADDKDPEVNIIQFDQPNLGMPSPDYFLDEDAPAKLAVYKEFAHSVATLFGANPVTALREIEEIVDFEVELAKITIPKEERRDNEMMYNKMSIKEFQEQEAPGFDWLSYIQRLFKSVDIDVDETEQIVVYAPSYFEQFVKVYQRTNKRVIVNYLIWRIMMMRVDDLPSQYKPIKNEFSKIMFGSKLDSVRWSSCVDIVKSKMGNAVGRLFVESHFDEGSKETALEMIHDIRNAFYGLLDESEWMDDATRIVAKEKAEAIAEKIGYADSILNDTALNAEYEDVEFYPNRYFDNVIANLKHEATQNLQQLRHPVDRTKWSTTPAVVNAFYSPTKNQIMFPAGLLQPPFYSKDYPKSLNYGGIGMVIGHEITHGFDDRGRQYDKNGILAKRWDDAVIQRFKERAQCIIDQYSNYSLPDVNMKVNGILTQGENIADNGGIKEAYRAYKAYVDVHGHSEPRLPGLLQFSGEQLFFINFAQVWCGVMRPEAAITRLKTGEHAPGRFRVIGTLQNLEAFSEAFNCPEDSYMNSRHKCAVW